MNVPPRMSDVAAAAGVHQSTVSLALRGDPRIPADTRARVEMAVARLGYRRNPLVSALIAERKRGRPSGKGAVLAVLAAGAKPEEWRRRSPIYSRLHGHLVEQAHRLGYGLQEFALHEAGRGPGRLKRMLHARGIRGLLLAPMPVSTETVDFDFTGFAAVALRLQLRDPALGRVAPDYFLAMSAALEKLWSTGHRRAAFLSLAEVDERVRHRSLGAYLAVRQSHPRRCLSPVTVDEWSSGDFAEWMHRHRPDAIVTPTHSVYRQVEGWLETGGWSAPHDLSLISLDCHAHTDEAGMVHNLELEAFRAVNMLARKVESAEFGVLPDPCQLAIPARWRDGSGFANRSGISRPVPAVPA